MDFNIKKPKHILALFLIGITFFLIVIYPIWIFFNFSEISFDYLQQFSEPVKFLIELFSFIFQLIFVIVLLIIFPILWYLLVNNVGFKKSLYAMKIKLKNPFDSIIWGIITFILLFGFSMVLGIIIIILGYNNQEVSNIPDLESIFSLPFLFIIVAFQPIAEEIFFRGFLLQKIKSIVGKESAIIFTSIFFGLAHLSYGNVYPAISSMVLGFVLSYIVIKKDNLLPAIIGHSLYNVITIILYLMAKSIPF